MHHPEDVAGSVRYINTLTDAVRRTGCRKLIFYNVSQDFRIGEAIRRSKAQGVSFGWYPTGLNAGYELRGNYLRGVDEFPDMLRPELAGLPRIVYEFDSPDLRNATMYPAMVRTFRRVGAQFAAMFAYDMLRTASRNLGWQTHYLNLVYTPRKAMSAVIAAEAMRRLPRIRDYGPYPRNTRFGDFRISAEEDLAELVADDAFLYAGSTRSVPPDPAALRRVAGYGSSPIVTYAGEGVYFLDRVEKGVWRLEVYPDAVPIRDPFEPPSQDKVVTRAIRRVWPMTVRLPDLGESFLVQPIAEGNPQPIRATGGLFPVRPGVYLLSATGPVEPSSLPEHVGHIGLLEYHAPPSDAAPPTIVAVQRPTYLTGRAAEVRALVADSTPPDSVLLYLRQAGAGSYRAWPMAPAEWIPVCRDRPEGSAARGTTPVRDHSVPWPLGGDLSRREPPHAHRLELSRVGAMEPRRRGSAHLARAVRSHHRHPSAHVHPHRRCGTPRALQCGNRRGDRAPDLPSVAAGGFRPAGVRPTTPPPSPSWTGSARGRRRSPAPRPSACGFAALVRGRYCT